MHHVRAQASSFSSSSESASALLIFSGVMRRTGVSVALESLPSLVDDFDRAMFGGAPRAFFGMSCGGKGLSVEVLTVSGVDAGDKTAVIGRRAAVSTSSSTAASSSAVDSGMASFEEMSLVSEDGNGISSTSGVTFG